MHHRLISLIWFWLGRWLVKQGIPVLAERCLRNGAAGTGRGAAVAWLELGRSLLARGHAKGAADAFGKATELDPSQPAAWCGLGASRRLLADLKGARDAYDEALRVDPAFPAALNNLGELLIINSQPAAALELLQRALRHAPDLMEATVNRVAALVELARFDEADEASRGAVERFPDCAAIHVNRGQVLCHIGQGRGAVLAFRRALECDPGCIEAHVNLAIFFGEDQHRARTVEYLEREISLKGETAQRLGALALAQSARRDFAAAEATCRKALEMQPGHISALETLAQCLTTRGDHRGAMEMHLRALQANPNMAAVCSNIAFTSTYLHDLGPEEVAAYHREWAVRFDAPLASSRHVHRAGGAPDRRLRIGYVSGDFGRHPVGFLIQDVLHHHNADNFEIHCYSMMRRDDDLTVEIRKSAHAWHDILLTGDADAARMIFDDGIDILVDLSGHTAYNRLSVFALRPAPVQVSWIGYFHSTGLESIDYYITDPYTSPPGCGQYFSETPVCLPHSRFCYSPPDYAGEVAPAPALTRGYVTFGSFNRIEKLVDPVLEAWAAILAGVPGSRLLIKAGALESETATENLRGRMAAVGMDLGRVELRGPSSHMDMFAQYGEVDIALDTFPFNGGMTTLEALWMGVPVVTLAGQGVVSRQTVSALANLGLAEELAFPDLESYIGGAVALAGRPERAAALRTLLRPRMQASPLCLAGQFARDLESLYRRMWQAHCRGEKLPGAV